jgi:hypothetical protein
MYEVSNPFSTEDEIKELCIATWNALDDGERQVNHGLAATLSGSQAQRVYWVSLI